MSCQDASKETLRIDFDDITAVFTNLKPAVLLAKNAGDFLVIVQPVVQDLFLKHFEFPNSRLYKPEDLTYLISHINDCVNNIMPVSIPFRSVVKDGQWRFVYDENKAEKKDPKPN